MKHGSIKVLKQEVMILQQKFNELLTLACYKLLNAKVGIFSL